MSVLLYRLMCGPLFPSRIVRSRYSDEVWHVLVGFSFSSLGYIFWISVMMSAIGVFITSVDRMMTSSTYRFRV